MQEGCVKNCRCVSCADCGGSGRIWLDFSGRYLGNARCDDLDQMDTCLSCGGDGITEVCSDCEENEDWPL